MQLLEYQRILSKRIKSNVKKITLKILLSYQELITYSYVVFASVKDKFIKLNGKNNRTCSWQYIKE